jgi:hypothetical protein
MVNIVIFFIPEVKSFQVGKQIDFHIIFLVHLCQWGFYFVWFSEYTSEANESFTLNSMKHLGVSSYLLN